MGEAAVAIPGEDVVDDGSGLRQHQPVILHRRHGTHWIDPAIIGLMALFIVEIDDPLLIGRPQLLEKPFDAKGTRRR
jgi:hypothetical protein